MRRALLTTMLLSLLGLQPGCSLMRNWASRAVPNPGEYADHTNDSNDPWVRAVGEEGRGGRPREKVDDPLNLRNMFTSEKSRDIERNLGID